MLRGAGGVGSCCWMMASRGTQTSRQHCVRCSASFGALRHVHCKLWGTASDALHALRNFIRCAASGTCELWGTASGALRRYLRAVGHCIRCTASVRELRQVVCAVCHRSVSPSSDVPATIAIVLLVSRAGLAFIVNSTPRAANKVA